MMHGPTHIQKKKRKGQRPSENRGSSAEQPNAVILDMFYERSPTGKERRIKRQQAYKSS